MRMGSSSAILIHKDCNHVVGEVSQLLTRSCFTVIESFDLQVAQASHPSYDCPRHGTDRCTCQLAILLVYGEDADPVSLMIDGDDERTELSMIETPGLVIKPGMKEKIAAALQSVDLIYTDDA